MGLALALGACAGADDQSARLAADFDQANAGLRAMQAGRPVWDAPPAPPRAEMARTEAAPTTTPASMAPTYVATSFAPWRGGPVRETAALLGAPAASLAGLLGEPELRRPEGDAETWLYRGRSCLLDVVMYPDPVTRQPRVGHAQARSAGVSRVTEEACLSEIASQRTMARLR